MQAMSEVNLFEQQMRFSAIRTYSVRAGLGDVVAVIFCPEALMAKSVDRPVVACAGRETQPTNGGRHGR